MDTSPQYLSKAFADYQIIYLNFMINYRRFTGIIFPLNVEATYCITTSFNHSDGVQRIIAIQFDTAGRYLTNIIVMMKFSDDAWQEISASSVYIESIYGY